MHILSCETTTSKSTSRLVGEEGRVVMAVSTGGRVKWMNIEENRVFCRRARIQRDTRVSVQEEKRWRIMKWLRARMRYYKFTTIITVI